MQARNIRPLPARAYQFSLHIRHPSLHPSEISRELQWPADESFAAGAPRQSLSGVVAAPLHSESYWAATLETSFWSVAYGGEPSSSIEDEEAAVSDAPPREYDRRARFQRLIALGRRQGYVMPRQITQHARSDREAEEVTITLMAIGIVVSERAPSLALRRSMSELLSRLARNADVNIALEMLSLRLANHASFFREIRGAGGSVALIGMLPSSDQSTLRLTPEVCRRLADLGITLQYESAGSER